MLLLSVPKKGLVKTTAAKAFRTVVHFKGSNSCTLFDRFIKQIGMYFKSLIV